MPSNLSKPTQVAQAVALSVEGHTRDEVAVALGVSPRTVKRWLASEGGQELLRSTVEHAREELSALATTAASTLGELLSSDNDHVRLGAARAILDRTGLGPGQKSEDAEETPKLSHEELLAQMREAVAKFEREVEIKSMSPEKAGEILRALRQKRRAAAALPDGHSAQVTSFE